MRRDLQLDWLVEWEECFSEEKSKTQKIEEDVMPR